MPLAGQAPEAVHFVMNAVRKWVKIDHNRSVYATGRRRCKGGGSPGILLACPLQGVMAAWLRRPWPSAAYGCFWHYR
jgi:hypothetical protein